MDLSNFVASIESAGIEYVTDEPMSNHTSFKIGGKCDVFITPKSADEISYLIKQSKKYGVSFEIVGKGSNLLVSDEGYRGAIICLSAKFDGIIKKNETTLNCQAGASLIKVCKFSLENSLSGIEFAYGIPGSIGGAVCMNAGAYGGEFKDIVESCDYIDENGDINTLSNKEIDFSYRKSFFSNGKKCIIGAALSLSCASKAKIEEKMKELLSKRIEKQPLEYPSAGSAFKRPVGSYASLLVDKCGLKGYRVGDAQISEKHAGFIINRANATCKDVKELINQVSEKVYKQTGFLLEPEIKFI